MADAQPDCEKRKGNRKRVLKQGAILRGPAHSETVCTIRNFSPDGAELKVATDQYVPDTFLLYVRTDGTAYRASVRWRAGQRVGVSFTGVEEKPKWHYGI